MGRKFALIIANKIYDDSRLSRLEAPDVDAGALETVLKTPEVGHFDDVTSLLNENCAVVRRAIARFFDQRQRDDVLLLYFAGLGIKDEEGRLYLAVRDTDSALLAGTAIESAFISGRMDGSVSYCEVLLLDCRYSAAFAAGSGAATGVSVGAARAFEGLGVGRVILAATDATQYAWDGDRLLGETQDSLFTRFLIDGLATGGADRDNDGVVTVDELYDYVHEHAIIAAPQHTPHKWTYRAREIILARNPFASPFTLPPEIEDARHSTLPSLRLDAVRSLETLLREQHTRAARAALRELSQDDSRRVAAAAIEALWLFDEKKRGGAVPMAGSARDPIAGTGTDIFISYAREDRAKAGVLARLLAARGWNVWWDRRIQPGEALDVVIERELSASKCVVVLWSANSVNARWVRNEARRASRRGVLVPIVVDRVETPLEFENLHPTDLTSWDESVNDAELETLFDRIEALSPIRHDRQTRLMVEGRRWRVDENVQFSVYRPAVVVPERWYPMLAFAHLSERRPDAPADDPDPIAEVQRQAQQILGADADAFAHVTEDSRHGIPIDGHLRIVPAAPGIDFNPPERSFLWTEPVHREEFRLRARRDVDGTTVRGTVSVFLGCVLVADVNIAVAVRSGAEEKAAPIQDVARPYRWIFASYSHRDTAVVRQFEEYARGFGDRYMRDAIDLRAGEVWDSRLAAMIEDADVFQLFWSWNAMGSPFVRAEWEHALKMNRASFIRPIYWETPFPERADLPPAALKALHFANVGTVVGTHHTANDVVAKAAGDAAIANTGPATDGIRAPVAPPEPESGPWLQDPAMMGGATPGPGASRPPPAAIVRDIDPAHERMAPPEAYQRASEDDLDDEEDTRTFDKWAGRRAATSPIQSSTLISVIVVAMVLTLVVAKACSFF